MKAFISKRAARAADRIDARWRGHADDPAVVAREFLEAVERLESTQGVGSSFRTARHPALRRILLPKSRCHISFEIDEAKQAIKILHIWDGRREQAPKLGASAQVVAQRVRRLVVAGGLAGTLGRMKSVNQVGGE